MAAALAISLVSSKSNFHPASYQQEPPKVDGNVVMVDFSYPRDVLIELASRVESIWIFDHHASAQRNLVDLPANVHVHFDMNKSGCVLAWEAVGDMPIPKFFDYIQDRDLWRFSLPHVQEIGQWIAMIPKDLRSYCDAMHDLEYQFMACVTKGSLYLEKHLAVIDEIFSAARPFRIDEFEVPCVASPYSFGSETCNQLAQGYPFAMYYIDHVDCRQFGLRSTPDGIDVSVIAERYGGGGHKHAAGFKVPRDHELAMR